MQCPMCGFARAGEARRCPSCGHEFARAAAPTTAGIAGAPAAPAVSAGTIRLILCAVVVFAAARGLASLGTRLIDAKQEQVEAALLGQAMEHKKQVRAVEEADGAR